MALIKLYKGGSLSRERLPLFLKFLSDNKNVIEQKRIKRVVIFLGTNDLINFGRRNKGGKDADSVEAIQKRISVMLGAAKEVGLSVVLCTIPYFKADKREKEWRKVHGEKYPYSAADLEKRAEQVNKFMLAQSSSSVKVLSLHEITLDQKKFPLSDDGLHFTAEASKELAKYIREEGRIGGYT